MRLWVCARDAHPQMRWPQWVSKPVVHRGAPPLELPMICDPTGCVRVCVQDEELLEYISEATTMSKALADYEGEQRARAGRRRGPANLPACSHTPSAASHAAL